MQISDVTIQTKSMIDDLKAVCANYGLGNSGNEYKIITEAFLYMDCIIVSEVAQKWGVSIRSITYHLVAGRIADAIKNRSLAGGPLR